MIDVFVNDQLIKFIEFTLYKSLETLAGSFSISTRKRLEIGNTITIKIDDQICLDGYIEVSTSRLSESGTSFIASGRDKTGDLVDSCIEIKEFKNIPILEAIEASAGKFGIKTRTTETFKISMKPNPDDSVFDALVKELNSKEMHLFTRNGELHMGKIKIDSMPEFIFEEGKNILSLDYTEDHTGRYKNYIGKKIITPDEKHAKDIRIEDSDIKRPRTLALVSEYPDVECKRQKDIRKAKSKIMSLTVLGFQQNKKLFEVGKTAHVKSHSMGLDENLIINSVTINISRSEKKVSKIELITPLPFKKDLAKPKKKASEWDLL